MFRGRAFGAVGERTGEVVFNTSMTGYQEVLTDPSYKGQIVVMTCPEIGNVGINPVDNESEKPQVEGFAIRELSTVASNWRANQAVEHYLREHAIPGISEIDTRAVTRHIRTAGAMKGVVSSVDRDAVSLVRKAREAPGLEELDLVRAVTCTEPHVWDEPRPERWASPGPGETPERRLKCVAFDFGAKRNIFRLLWEHGFEVNVVPATTSADDVLGMRPDTVFLSNGPGDPTTAGYAVETVGQLIGRIPIFGICLGHQIAALAMGGRTFKLKFGHRGANHPVQDLRTSKVAVTSQNHGYAVDPESLPARVEITHVNLNDGTCEGYVDAASRLLAVQYHPESSPGPHDSLGLFQEFLTLATVDRSTGREVIEGGR
jgi:carbamoyl-phosphate synthase small subunit